MVSSLTSVNDVYSSYTPVSSNYEDTEIIDLNYEDETAVVAESESDISDSDNDNSEIEINSIEELKEEYEKIQDEQGIVGKTFDTIKNKFSGIFSKFGWNGSDEMSEIIAKAEAGEITLEEAEEALNKYKKNQENVTNTVLNTATFAVVSGVLLLATPLGWGAAAILGAACVTGAVVRVGLGVMEAATNEVEGDYTFEDAKDDAEQGIIVGFLAAFKKITGIKLSQKDTEKAKNTTNIASSAYALLA
ncbi:MAG: hypothetical protein LUH05_00085 [Candidatus Gastranaerophilales bacterium]|nr:hypothetical protein [Candidatus Gastranaerophilales bacterium]